MFGTNPASIGVRGFFIATCVASAWFGLSLWLRRAFGDWRVFATADVGRERINHDVEKPTSQISLTAQRSFANDVALGFQFTYFRASDFANNEGASDRYAWRMARLYFTVPF